MHSPNVFYSYLIFKTLVLKSINLYIINIYECIIIIKVIEKRKFMAIKNLSIRIDNAMLDKLHIISDYEGRSASSQVIILIRDLIKEYEKITKKYFIIIMNMYRLPFFKFMYY